MTKYPQPFDQNPNLFLPSGWNDGWLLTRVNAAAGGNARVLCYGDSLTNGTLASDAQKTAWPGVLKAWLLQILNTQLVAEYWTEQAATNVPNHPWSSPLNSASFSTFYGFGWNYIDIFSATALNAYQQYTTPDPCTAFDVFFNDFTAGTWQFLVDSGTPGNAYSWAISGNGSGNSTTNVNVTVTNLGNGTAGNAVIRRLSITGLPLGVHTFTYGWQSVANTAPMNGAAHYPNLGKNGLSFARNAHQGADLYHQGLNANKPANTLRLNAPYNPNQDGATALTFGWPLVHDLAIIMMGVNDLNNNGSGILGIQQYGGALHRLISALKRGNPSCSTIIVIPSYPNPDSSDCNPSGFTNAQYWVNYVDQAYAVANLTRSALLNIHARWGETPHTQGFLPTTDLHPTDAGHADIVTALKDLL